MMAQLLDSEPAAAPSSCPSCDSDVLNVQGIHTCSGCPWLVPEYR
ncbi:MAG: hypothetical protein ABEJ82_00950 [Haloplanus sp.]